MERYTKEEIAGLDTKHTKQLLNLRNSYYVNTGYCLDWCGELPECKECRSNIKFNTALIKKLLSTREHVLNKQESKALRKQRIKEGR